VGVPFITLAEIKTFIGKTGTDDDVLIASIASNASAMAERHTGRIFGVQSNTTYRYSADGQNSITIHDHPYNDTTRTVTWNGATLVEGTNVWFLPDRRNQDVSITVQMRPYNTNVAGWYKVDPQWWDKNLDNPRWSLQSGLPNDLVIVGTVGHPVIAGDVKQATLELAAYLYAQTKGGPSSFTETLQGTDIILTSLPRPYQDMVQSWRIRTAVVDI